jgi:Protein of unknown function (DUF4054)
MNITSQFFLSLFEEFRKVPRAQVNAYITIATGRVPQSVWGTQYQYATALLVAHMLSTRGRQGGGSAGGAVTAEAVGELSRSFATMFDVNRGDALLLTTRYGADFVQLRKETVIGVMSTRNPGPPFGESFN